MGLKINSDLDGIAEGSVSLNGATPISEIDIAPQENNTSVIKFDGLEGLATGAAFAIETKTNLDYSGEDISKILQSEIKSDNNSTISLFYREADQTVVLAIDGVFPKIILQEMTPYEYLELCKTIDIEENNDYNISRSIEKFGIYVRIFALTRPVSSYPNITISTAKIPPAIWGQPELDPILEEITKENFVIIGASGAGKSYAMNYILKKLHNGSNSKIGIIEEFSELFPPNNNSLKLITPPVKPGEKSLLKFLTEQSNLMRLDYLYVGEIKGEEALPFVMNLSSGTKGAATLHGSSVRLGLGRLSYLAMMAGAPLNVVSEAISKSIKYCILMEKHRITEIHRLTGTTNGQTYSLEKIWPN